MSNEKLKVEAIFDYQHGLENISRFKVFGGWVVRSQRCGNTVDTESSVFVPDPNHEWDVEILRSK